MAAEEGSTRGRRYARGVIANPTQHGRDIHFRHPEVQEEWIERVITEPYLTEIQRDGRIRYWGAVPEVRNWLRLVVENNQLHTATLDGSKRREWGTPT